MKTGNTATAGHQWRTNLKASMEPGHEDREYGRVRRRLHALPHVPQWSPVMKTGNTTAAPSSV